jgi:hypothetical protein
MRSYKDELFEQRDIRIGRIDLADVREVAIQRPKTLLFGEEPIYHRGVASALTGCLSPGVPQGAFG